MKEKQYYLGFFFQIHRFQTQFFFGIRRSRRDQTTNQKFHKSFKNGNNSGNVWLNIWNLREKCIKISTNMPGIGLESCEILRIWETKRFCIDGGWY